MTKDYSKSKLYFLRSNQTEKIYVGSTIQSLTARFNGHTGDYKRFKNGNFSYLTAFELMKYDDVYIELIRICPCETKEELNRIEGEEIKKHNCVNKRVEGRTIQEWKEDTKEQRQKYLDDTKEQRKIRDKIYHEKNKLHRNKKCQEYYINNKQNVLEKSKEHYEKNKELVISKVKQYYSDNKDKINERRSTIIECDCGSKVWKNNLSNHRKTKKHLEYIKAQTN